jgi:hypothetical protein
MLLSLLTRDQAILVARIVARELPWLSEITRADACGKGDWTPEQGEQATKLLRELRDLNRQRYLAMAGDIDVALRLCSKGMLTRREMFSLPAESQVAIDAAMIDVGGLDV